MNQPMIKVEALKKVFSSSFYPPFKTLKQWSAVDASILRFNLVKNCLVGESDAVRQRL
jgi:hypothetical protein